jgi:hypothetical protein
MHIAHDRGDPEDVVHEAVHLAARHVRTVRRVAVSPEAEEAMARSLDGSLPFLLEFYGYEIRRIVMKDLETYLRDNEGKGCIEHVLRISPSADGRLHIYIHPAGVDGDTLDFYVMGNTLEALR